VKVRDEYDAVNEVLDLVGEEPIEMPDAGSPREKLERLLQVYAGRLRRRVPAYADVEDDRLLPDMVVQHLVAVLDEVE